MRDVNLMEDDNLMTMSFHWRLNLMKDVNMMGDVSLMFVKTLLWR